MFEELARTFNFHRRSRLLSDGSGFDLFSLNMFIYSMLLDSSQQITNLIVQIGLLLLEFCLEHGKLQFLR